MENVRKLESAHQNKLKSTLMTIRNQQQVFRKLVADNVTQKIQDAEDRMSHAIEKEEWAKKHSTQISSSISANLKLHALVEIREKQLEADIAKVKADRAALEKELEPERKRLAAQASHLETELSTVKANIVKLGEVSLAPE